MNILANRCAQMNSRFQNFKNFPIYGKLLIVH